MKSTIRIDIPFRFTRASPGWTGFWMLYLYWFLFQSLCPPKFRKHKKGIPCFKWLSFQIMYQCYFHFLSIFHDILMTRKYEDTFRSVRLDINSDSLTLNLLCTDRYSRRDATTKPRNLYFNFQPPFRRFQINIMVRLILFK